MNPTLTTFKTTLKFVTFLIFFMPITSLADTFIKIQELTNTFKGGALDISASENGRYVFVRDMQQVYWLMNITRPLAFHKIFNDKPDSTPFEYKPLRAQWHNNHIMFFSNNKTEFYNVQSQKIDQRYPLILSRFGSKIIWSKKHQRFIVGTKVFSVDSDTEEDPSQDAHAYQTGLLIMDNGDDYITAGFHDQRIIRWILPAGELKKTWRLGSWHASHKVTDIALIDNQLLVATNNGKISVRSIEDDSVPWSASPCSSFFSSESPHFMLNGSVRQKNKSVHHNKLIFYRCQGTEVKYGFVEKQGDDWKLEKIALLSTGDASLERVYYLDSINKAILGLDDGQVLLYDLKNKSIDQVIVPKSAEGKGTALFAYLKADKLLVVVNDKTVDIYQYQ